MIKEWIATYKPANEDETLSALREIMQEIALAGLSRTDFFKTAAFYGGTALRIFYGLNRYSEDLDFSLLQKNENFSLAPYFLSIQKEFESLGLKVSLRNKLKTKKTAIESAFLKTETLWEELVLEDIVAQIGIRSNKNIKIKIEVDRNPPQGFNTEEKLMLRPFSFYVKCFDQPSLFAGKMHALLFRKWKNRVKGRDWYDWEWFVRKDVPLNLSHFLQRARDTGDWTKKSISKKQFLQLLTEKINTASFENIKADVRPFIKDAKQVNIWSKPYFLDLVALLKVEE
ncbi:MAG TPA: nucleotidyl transferase AbiEii/AbiGii toxin family protein [Chitinophagaceae bacterium]|nr:nucleotidyl transferase AbiEii/AbiGii toxin family protein [Chitinophagaceae bacterium]HNL60937.1 nucleotidyl transferase AbiEii/AbiGii toxin family protein [Chitinophagaceae bacterium]HNO00630.1 nucleotidyl transferase AbiEii/AbiGii toxin family protein [Chitinophagaceae bacterium]HNO55878.1 nucleotidyl transferase AbiEii/AbiGii toxin family protein [Chitinophagaceae bacterium]